MRHRTVLTANVARALLALDTLHTRSPSEEGMGLIYGRPGEGKSTTVSYLVNRSRGVFLRANVGWTVTAMLQALVRELDLEPKHRRAAMIDAAIEGFAADPRPLFIDEADYLLRQMDMLDALRDIYDCAGVPVVFVTMENAPRKIRTTERLARVRRRITQWVEFTGLDHQDARKVAAELCEVELDGPLLERLHAETRGNIGLFVVGLSRIEHFAKANRLSAVALNQYGTRPLN